MTSRSSFLFFAVLLSAVPALSQQHDYEQMTDDAFLRLLSDRRGVTRVKQPASVASTPGVKCPFDLTCEIARRMTTMNAAARTRLQTLVQPLPKDTSILSPSGRFRVEFDLAGPDAPTLLEGDSAARIPGSAVDYATEVAKAFDRCYDVQVSQIGYAAPPLEAGRSQYRIVIREMGGDYGQTLPLAQLPSSTVMPTWTSYIELDNDFAGHYYSKGLRGAQVTAAHEFHHMVQLGSYGLWNNDRWMHEMTSTYYEDVVFEGVNDYRQYLRYFFAHPERPLYSWSDPSIDGYRCVMFAKMLHQKFGPLVLRHTWDGMTQHEPVQSMDDALKAASPRSDLSSEICSFGRWNYYTSYRWGEDSVTRYTDGAEYPAVAISAKLPISGGAGNYSGIVAPFAAQYVIFYRGSDTAAFAIVNTNVNHAKMRSFVPTGYSLQIKTENFGADYLPVGNGWGYKFTPGEVNALCLNVFSRSGTIGLDMTVAYPNPYDPRTDGLLRLSIPVNAEETKASYHIFSAGMELIAKGENVNILPDPVYGRHIAWSGKNLDNEDAGSGVYFYIVTYGETTVTGKIAVVNR